MLYYVHTHSQAQKKHFEDAAKGEAKYKSFQKRKKKQTPKKPLTRFYERKWERGKLLHSIGQRAIALSLQLASFTSMKLQKLKMASCLKKISLYVPKLEEREYYFKAKKKRELRITVCLTFLQTDTSPFFLNGKQTCFILCFKILFLQK